MILCEVNGQRLQVEEELLVKTEGSVDNDVERTTWVEYRYPGSDVVVHRSCHVVLKKGLDAVGALQHFDVDAWARDVVAALLKKREETGQPVTLQGKYTLEELAALNRAVQGVGTVEMEKTK